MSKQYTYVFDILSCSDTIAKLLILYGDGIVSSESNDYDEKLWEGMKKLLPRVYKSMWKDVASKSEYVNGIKIGDIINVSYIPSSQKYIDHYKQQDIVNGSVLFVDAENNDAIVVIKYGDIVKFQSLVREGCHYLGMSNGYDCLIDKVR
jgi:hypothetical protein